MILEQIMEPQPRTIRQEGTDFVTILNDCGGRWISPYGKKGDTLKIIDAYPTKDERGQWLWVIELENLDGK
jgi:hypothetical protein